jgi:CRISPR/Cas system-associated exonuclease Cas4 (RecB family)
MVFSIKESDKFTEMLKSNLREKYDNKNRQRSETVAHISDLVTENCIRKSWYKRKFPDVDEPNDITLMHYLRGESAQYAISQLAKFDVDQTEFSISNADGSLVGHMDAVYKNDKSDMIAVEIKDTNSLSRHHDDMLANDTMRAYVTQLLYYLVVSGLEHGTLCIKYNSNEMKWSRKDADNSNWYKKGSNSRPPEIVAFDVVLSSDDPLRRKLQNEVNERKRLLLDSIHFNDVSMLSRLNGTTRFIKCRYCPYYSKCFNEDGQKESAIIFGSKVSAIDQFTAEACNFDFDK